ncbi:hypothetical protein ABZZ01_32455 [Streptomyces virginiae]|uniref:hypothetical protein n=1 Tax=Streptomyces virginiae TaxID=1961 RepID=UPI0033B3F472
MSRGAGILPHPPRQHRDAGRGPASAWLATAAAADAELAHLAELLAEAGVTALPAAGVPAVPGHAAGIRVRTTSNPPHALYVIVASSITPHAGAGSALAHLRPHIEAAARSCDGCYVEAYEPCNPHCLPDPSND